MGKGRKIGFSTKVAVISPDKHFAHSVNGQKAMDRHDPAAISIFLQIVKDIKPDIHVGLGDTAHLAYLSHWNISKGIGGRAKSEDGETIAMSLQEDNNLINRYFDNLQKSCKKDSEYIELEGNHEEILRNSRSMPLYSGFVTSDWYPERAWRFAERGVKWIPYQKYGNNPNWYQLGPYLRLVHGHYAGTNHLTRHFLDHLTNVHYGHLHTIEEKAFRSPSAHISVKTLGCLCTPTASYHRGTNNAWGQGFEIVYLLPNGQFHDQFIKIIKGKAVYNGKVYTAKPESWME
jgi:hypothetical protein